MKKKIFLLLMCLLLLASPALAHPGRTDSQGGHTNHSTGEYHYHHGYPAHQHENGICPYDFDDKTDHGSSSPTKILPESTPEKEENVESVIRPAFIPVAVAFILLGCSVVYISRRKARKREAEEKIRLRKLWDEKYDGKPFDEIFNPPPGFTLGEDGKPVCSFLSEDELMVCASQRGGKYHRRNCRYALPLLCPLWEATSMGCTPCKVCSPPTYDFTWYWRYIALKKELAQAGVKIVLEDGTVFLEDIEGEGNTE